MDNWLAILRFRAIPVMWNDDLPSLRAQRWFTWRPADRRGMLTNMKSFAPETEPTHDSQGVDLTLIRWMLDLTPRERVEHIQDLADSLEKIRTLNGGSEPD